MYVINIRQWEVYWRTLEQVEKPYSATSTFKCGGSTAAVLVRLEICIMVLWDCLNESNITGN